MVIHVLIGISGSGKTTWCTKHIKENTNQKIIRVNRDTIRESLFVNMEDYYVKSCLGIKEKIVDNIQSEIIESAIYEQFDIIVDNTNLNIKYINHVLDCLRYNYELKFVMLDSTSMNPGLCKKRVMERNNFSEDQVVYIDRQYKDYIKMKEYIERYFENIEKIYL